MFPSLSMHFDDWTFESSTHLSEPSGLLKTSFWTYLNSIRAAFIPQVCNSVALLFLTFAKTMLPLLYDGSHCRHGAHLVAQITVLPALGELLMGRLAETREWRIGVQIEEYSIIFYLCICLWGNHCRKEKFGSMFTSWSKHLYTGSSSIRHECGDGHQKSDLQIQLQRTEKTSWISAEKTICAVVSPVLGLQS
jgi:hypothetical protein